MTACHCCVWCCMCASVCGRGKLIKCRTVVAKFVAILRCKVPAPPSYFLSFKVDNQQKIHKSSKKIYKEFHAHLTKWFYRFWYLLICWSGSFVEFRINIVFVGAVVLAIYEAVSFVLQTQIPCFVILCPFFCIFVRAQSCKAFLCLRWQKCCYWIWYVNHILCFIFCASTIWLPTSALLRYLSAGQKGVKCGTAWW